MSRKLKPYEPNAEDLAWARTATTITRDGGVVGTSTGVYRVNKADKTFTLFSPTSPWDNPHTLMLHHRHTYVFQAIGWTVQPAVDWDKIELPDEPKETTDGA